jgi:abortive infection bacteriophage resistance protein
VAIPYSKPALTFEQQLDLLQARGLAITDRDAALVALGRISYYRLSAYWYPLRAAGEDRFVPGATFDMVLRLYEFDRRLRLLALDGIERVEVLARTRITYELAHQCDPFAHSHAGHFEGSFDHGRWYQAFIEDLIRASESFLEHYRAKHDGYPRVPIWMASEVMSFGKLSQMFKGMRKEQQTPVAAVLGVHRSVAASWLHSLSYVRNVCAHHGRLWNRELAIKPLIPSGKPEWAPVKNNRMYAILCMLRHLTTPCNGGTAWADGARSLLREMDGEGRWQRAMGVPQGWATHLFWR